MNEKLSLPGGFHRAIEQKGVGLSRRNISKYRQNGSFSGGSSRICGSWREIGMVYSVGQISNLSRQIGILETCAFICHDRLETCPTQVGNLSYNSGDACDCTALR